MEKASFNRTSKKASISIILPTYNVEKYIGQCLDTIFTQTWPNIECIIVDDCCTDRSIGIAEEKIKSYKADGGHIDFKIVRHEKNRGAAAARNTGMDAASGDYLWWVDPDDHIAEDAVFDLLHSLGDERPDIIAFGNSGYVDNHPEKGYEYVPNMGYTTIQAMLNCIIVEGTEGGTLWRKLFRRGFLIENGIRSTEGVQVANDWDFYVNMIDVGYARIKNDYHCCYFYRYFRKGSLLQSKKDAVSFLNTADRYISELEHTSPDRKQFMIEAAAERIRSTCGKIAYGEVYNTQDALQMLIKNKKKYTDILKASIKPKHKRLGVLLNKSVRLTLILSPYAYGLVRKITKWRSTR